MAKYEHCCECDERTGRAGASDDSLYLGSIGPFCEDCVNTWPDKVAQENSKLQYRNRELESRVAELEDLIRYAQVDSGVCMCGDNIKGHNKTSGHAPVDIWDHAKEKILEGGNTKVDEPTERFEPCSHCDGDGTYYGLSYDGDPYSCKCPKCDGTGIEL